MTATPANAAERFDDPVAVAEAVATTLAAPPLIAFDVDGVLAPIVAHASDAALLPGALDRLIALAAAVPVGVVSGRSVGDLARFGFPASLMVAGSHGAERRGLPLAPLTPAEAARLERLTSLAETAAQQSGRGAWVEHKPTGVVLHVREAVSAAAEPAVEHLRSVSSRVAGAQVKVGHGVIELTARVASKGVAVQAMLEESGAAAVAYTGDDATDEDVFTSLGRGDIGIKVGSGTTAAGHRLADPAEVLRYLARLRELLA